MREREAHAQLRGQKATVFRGAEQPEFRGDAECNPAFRLYALAAGVAALPFALAATAVEVAARSGGTIYVEARREPTP